MNWCKSEINRKPYPDPRRSSLALRSKRNEILASNIANAATPNFKAKDLDFDIMLQSKLGFGKVNTTDKRHFDVSLGANEEGVKFRQNVTPSKDGNTVELHVEQMQFSENVMRYQTSLEFLNRKNLWLDVGN